MKNLKILLLLPVIFLLCGCTTKDYGQLDDLSKSIIDDLMKDGIVTSCECPNIYVRSFYWQAMLLQQKETVGKIYITKCQSPVIFKDAHDGKNLMKCNSTEYNAKCKMYK